MTKMARSASASATSAPASAFAACSKQLDIDPGEAPDRPVHHGGPVEPGRGFVLHSTDWGGQDTLHVVGAAGELCAMTGTIDVLKAIAEGRGPAQWVAALGYAGWGEGQLEEEMTRHGWFAADGRSGDPVRHPDRRALGGRVQGARRRPAPAVERNRRRLTAGNSTYKEFFIFALAASLRLGAAAAAHGRFGHAHALLLIRSISWRPWLTLVRPIMSIKDISLAAFGRKEIEIAETEMPGPDGAARGVWRVASR